MGVPIIYANWVAASPGPLDLALDFGYAMPGEPAQAGVRVAMTWEHAKLLRAVMDNIIKQRESNVGEITEPAGMELVERNSVTGEPRED